MLHVNAVAESNWSESRIYETAPKNHGSHGFQTGHNFVGDTWSDLWLVSSISLSEAMQLYSTLLARLET